VIFGLKQRGTKELNVATKEKRGNKQGFIGSRREDNRRKIKGPHSVKASRALLTAQMAQRGLTIQ